MAWVTPVTNWTTGQIYGATDMNNIGGNLALLYSTVTAWKLFMVGGSDVTTTSATFVDMDATNMGLSITPERAKIAALCVFLHNLNSSTYAFDLSLSGTRAGDATNGLAVSISGMGRTMYSILGYWAVTPGTSYTIRLQAKRLSGATAGGINANSPFSLFAWEL